MTREERNEAKRRARLWFAALIDNAEPMMSGAFDDLSEGQHDVIEQEKVRIAERIERMAKK
ncbi:hypothetical protein [Pseudomonas sp. NBRC 111130]|uniref:hypothetical protein n=1 Tax=Pseudomonas sp. NBRC 111130 TaxID=1661045 RepID=UPI0006D454F8|nr:hypothetical protein [Pseudomonas sp. NBRC 111130]